MALAMAVAQVRSALPRKQLLRAVAEPVASVRLTIQRPNPAAMVVRAEPQRSREQSNFLLAAVAAASTAIRPAFRLALTGSVQQAAEMVVVVEMVASIGLERVEMRWPIPARVVVVPATVEWVAPVARVLLLFDTSGVKPPREAR
jgi:hypothetical protein